MSTRKPGSPRASALHDQHTSPSVNPQVPELRRRAIRARTQGDAGATFLFDLMAAIATHEVIPQVVLDNLPVMVVGGES